MTTPMQQWDAAEFIGKDGLESADGAGADAALAVARVPAWHNLGTVFDREMTRDEALELSHLGGWDVRKVAVQTVPVPVLTDDGVTEQSLPVPNRWTIVRDNPYTHLPEAFDSSVGRIFRPIQNEELVALAYALLDESEGAALIDTIGSLEGGRNVFVTLKLPRTILVGGEDAVELNLALMNNHCGTGSQVSVITPERVVCRNSFRRARGNFKSIHKIRHTESAQGKLQIAREELKLSFAFADELDAELQQMVDAPMTEAKFVTQLRKIWPVVKTEDASKRAATIQQERETAILRLFADSPTAQTIKGTRWGAYNAVTEYVDYFQPVPSTAKDPQLVRANRVVRAAIGKPADDVKAQAYELLAVR
jgi:phage/plasmid-like protein (TIGR03299 family)